MLFIKRARKAVLLTVGFFSGNAIALGVVPFIYLSLQRVGGNKKAGDLRDMIILGISYCIVAAGVFAWKFFSVQETVMRDEERASMVQRRVHDLDPTQKEALRYLLLYGRTTDQEFCQHLGEAKILKFYPNVVRGLQQDTHFLTYYENTKSYEIKPLLIDPIEKALKKYFGAANAAS
jgi:Na+/melibiose symporter-like transporter